MANPPERKWRTVWIVGASTGIGREMALQLAQQCDAVYISARSADKLAELAAQSDRLHPLPLDITDEAAVNAAAASIAASGQPLDLLVTSVAMWQQTRISEWDPGIFRRAMETNFVGPVVAISAVAPAMIERGQGQIAIIGSVSGYRGLPNAATYAPTKAALINLAECIRPQLARKGVKVSIVNPGFVDTPLTATNTFPMPFLQTPQKAAEVIIGGLERERYEIAFPWQMVLPLKLMRMLPNRVFFWLVDKLVLK